MSEIKARPEEMREMSEEFQTQIKKYVQLKEQINNAINNDLKRSWISSKSDDFQQQYNSKYKPMLDELEKKLTEFNVDFQRATDELNWL